MNENQDVHVEGVVIEHLQRRTHRPRPPGPTSDPRSDLLIAAWLKRDIPLRDFLLGTVLCTTSRWLIFGDTGVGKTLLAMAIGGAVASGSPLIKWGGYEKPRRVMYLDGEMPSETFKERIELVAQRYGGGIPFYGYNRDDLADRAMPPLNTEDGEKWLMNEIDIVRPDLLIGDSVMSLLIGSMGEEESWSPMKPVVRRISSKRIAQIWLHHTGHDPGQSFGTKTREWEMDTVLSLAKAGEEDEAIAMEFRKARLRTPQNWEQFQSATIRLTEDGWIDDGPIPKSKTGRRPEEVDQVRRAFVAAYHRLADSVEKTPGFDGKPVIKVEIAKVRDELKSRGALERNDKGGDGLSATGRTHFRRAKMSLLDSGGWVEKDGLIWKGTTSSEPAHFDL
jgi:hypothetical protein